MGGILLFIFCLILSFVTGYLYGDTFGGHKQVGGDNCVQIQTEEILLNANHNKEISNKVSSNIDSHKNKLLNKLNKKINKAALNGQTHIDLFTKYNLNKKIDKYFTREELEEYFGSRGYHITFKYNLFDDASINRISWERNYENK